MNPLPNLEWQLPVGEALGEQALADEWQITNGAGGYASGTIGWCNTRKYHGLFVPALPGFGRTVMLTQLEDELTVADRMFQISGGEEEGGALRMPSLEHLTKFELHGLIPRWELGFGELRLQKSVLMVHNENTLFVVYTHLGGPAAKLRLRPYPNFRPHDAAVSSKPVEPHVNVDGHGVTVQVGADAPALKLRLIGDGANPFTVLYQASEPMLYRVEAARGYPAMETLISPGTFECTLAPGGQVALGVTLGGWESLDRAPADVLRWEEEREAKLLEKCAARDASNLTARLALAADQFIIAPKHRPPDAAWARATGQDVRSVIAGYHWFTDWGRDTMISLEGLTLCTGRTREAAAILRTFLHHVRDGLVPNYFPEGEQQGVYHTADATLWFFHAIGRYFEATGDRGLLSDFWPTLQQIIAAHQAGTRFGIGVDATDGLLRQGQEGYQLTWMDAKVDGWVVTPRRGKAVEINALWFNALKLMERWAIELDQDPAAYAAAAEKAQASFNTRFWNAREGCLFDVVDGERGDDAAIRPNQLFAISLDNVVLESSRWQPVMEVVRRELLTPYGVRTLSPNHPDFKASYAGDLRTRDGAYHQGTVWPWLLGHYLDASLKAAGAEPGAVNEVLNGVIEHLHHAGVGSVSEIFDAMPPYHPRGCIAQAWSVAETLRAWQRVCALKKTAGAPAALAV